MLMLLVQSFGMVNLRLWGLLYIITIPVTKKLYNMSWTPHNFVLPFYVCTDIIPFARGYKYLNFPSSSYNFGIKWGGKKFGGEE